MDNRNDHIADHDMRSAKEAAERNSMIEMFNHVISRHVSEYDAVMIADLNTGLYRTVSENEGIRTDAGPIPFQEAVVKNVLKYVHDDDKEYFRSSTADFEKIRKEYAVGEARNVEYRSFNGRDYTWYRIRLNRISENELLIAIKNCDEEMKKKIAADVLLTEYDAIYELNLDTDEVRPVRASTVSAVGAFKENRKYSKTCLEFAETVDPQYRQDWIDFSDPAFIKKYMADESHREYVFELPGAKDRLRRFSIDILERGASGEASVVLLSFMGIDEHRSQTILMNRRMAQTNRIVESLSKDFSCVNYIEFNRDRESDITEGYRTSGLFKKLIPGWEDAKSFSDKMRLLSDSIPVEDKARFSEETGRDILIRKLQDEDIVFVDTRLLIEGTARYYQFKFSAVRENGRLIGMVAGLHSVDEQIRREIEARAHKEQNEQMKQQLELINGLASGYNALYYINIDDDILQIYALDEAKYPGSKAIFETEEKDFYRIIGGYGLSEQVHPDDRHLFERFGPEWIREMLSGRKKYSMRFRAATESGYRWDELELVKYEPADEQANAVAIGFTDRDEEIRAEQAQKAQIQEALTFTNFFLDTYVSAYYIDFDDLSCQVYKRTAKLENEYPIITNYFDSLADYINHDVHPDDREALLEIVLPDRMREILKEKPEYSHIFRDTSGGIEKYYRMQVIRGAEERYAAFGFIDVTDEVNEQNNRLKEAEEARKLIDSIAASYNLAYSVNLKSDRYKVIRDDGMLIGTNQAFRSFTEAKESFIGLLPEADRPFMSRELDYGTIKGKLKSTKSYDVEYRVPINGGMVWHTMNVTLIDNEYIAIGFAKRDVEITQKHLEGKRYNEYFALYEIDIDSGMMKIVKDSPYYGIDRYGTALPFSRAMLQFASGLDDEPRAFFEQFSDLGFVKEQFAKEDKITYAYHSPNVGDKLWVDCTGYVTKRYDDGTPAMFTLGFSLLDSLGVYRQELQQKYVEQNAVLISQQEELETARDVAESANKAKTDFLFSMSHDIRTPMNAIMGFTNMAIKHIDDREKAIDCLEKTQKAGSMLLSLINSVLEMSRIESGHATLEKQQGDVYYSFANIENTMREMAESKDIDLSFEFGDIRDRYVYADFSRCMRIFVNVISNAIKYTPEGGSVKVKCVQLGNAEDGIARYQYTISDNGIGMSEEYQKHIFEQFSREQTSTVSGIQGSGLGMSVVKSFVDLMGGSVGVQSKQGEGSTFTIVLPFRLQEKEEYTDPITGEIVTPSGHAFKETEEISFAGKSVLLVEDNELNREIAIDILEEAGLMVEDADDGTAAVEKLREKGPGYYDFVLMDIQMPIMNGYEATAAIRKMYPDAKLPIIALSANAFTEDRKKSLAAGMDDHVAKPINIRDLFAVLAKFLG